MVGKGRRKTENKLVENKGARPVSFSKRRTGLFKKARGSSISTGAQVDALAFSLAGKPMTSDDPTLAPNLAPALETLVGAHELIFSELPRRPVLDDDWESLFYESLDGKTGTLWWENADVMSMEPEELQRFQGAILSYNEKLVMDASFLTSEQQYVYGRFMNARLEQESFFEQRLNVSLNLVPDLTYPESTFEQHLDVYLDLVPDLPYPFSTDSNVFPSDLLGDSMDNYIMNLPWDRLPELLGDEFQ